MINNTSKKLIQAAVFICSLLFCQLSVEAQTSSDYQAGNSLRVDFEGKHKIRNPESAPVASYQPGGRLRIDFEGSHRKADQSRPVMPAYTPGPRLRMDFEGKHRSGNH